MYPYGSWLWTRVEQRFKNCWWCIVLSFSSHLTGELQEEVTYAEPVLVPQTLNKPVNLMLNMSPKATLKTPGSNTPGANVGTLGAPMGPSLGLPTTGVSAGPHDIPLHYTPESYSTHGTLRSSEKYGTRGRDHRPRDYDHRLVDGYSTTRSVKKVYLWDACPTKPSLPGRALEPPSLCSAFES